MNKIIIMGRLTRDPDVRKITMQDGSEVTIARYTLAIERKLSKEMRVKEGVQEADFVSTVAFGKAGDFAEKYLKKGAKVVVTGRIQTGSYTNKDGQKIYTTDVVAEEQEFAESKRESSFDRQSRDEALLNSYMPNSLTA